MTSRRTFVLDTSVLLSDPGALLRFGDADVVLPLVVIGELEDKRSHPELGWFARSALRILDDLRVAHGRLDAPVPVGDAGGTLHVELNHSDPAVLPAGFRNDSNDSRIMVVALNLRAEGRDVCLITKDVPLRVKAAAVGLDTDEYRALDAVAECLAARKTIVVRAKDDEGYTETTVDAGPDHFAAMTGVKRLIEIATAGRPAPKPAEKSERQQTITLEQFQQLLKQEKLIQ